MSVLKSQQLQKIKYVFEMNSSNGKTISSKYVKRFFSDIGLSNDLFINELNYYFPQLKKPNSSLTYEDCISFLDYMLTVKSKEKQQAMESFKIFDKNGNGQINTSDLLLTLKKRLPKKQFQLYNQMLSTTFGPTINYLEVFNGKVLNA